MELKLMPQQTFLSAGLQALYGSCGAQYVLITVCEQANSQYTRSFVGP
jgi:hypothetical protein